MSLFKIQYRNALNNGAEDILEADSVEADSSGMVVFFKGTRVVSMYKTDLVVFIKSVPSEE